MQILDYPSRSPVGNLSEDIAQPSHNLNKDLFRSYFATGIAIVSMLDLGRPIGFTAHALNTISLTPPMISLCVSNQSASWPLFEEIDTFCVNLLSEDQEHLCGIFARSGGTRFQTSERQQTHSGVPILAGILTWIECKRVNVVTAGDQMIILGQVLDMAPVGQGKPLIFYQGQFGTFTTIYEG